MKRMDYNQSQYKTQNGCVGFKKMLLECTVQLKDFHEESYENLADTARTDL